MLMNDITLRGEIIHRTQTCFIWSVP